jgi:hypothetical protein
VTDCLQNVGVKRDAVTGAVTVVVVAVVAWSVLLVVLYALGVV